MTCNVQGKGTFVNQQQCLYDKTTNTYALYGAPYECGGELVYLTVICVIYPGINVLLSVYKKKNLRNICTCYFDKKIGISDINTLTKELNMVVIS